MCNDVASRYVKAKLELKEIFMRLRGFLEMWGKNYHSRLRKIPKPKGQISLTRWRQPEITQKGNLFNCAINYGRLSLDEAKCLAYAWSIYLHGRILLLTGAVWALQQCWKNMNVKLSLCTKWIHTGKARARSGLLKLFLFNGPLWEWWKLRTFAQKNEFQHIK